MSEEEEFERTEYGELDEGQSGADHTTAKNALLVAPQCSHDECTNATEDPAEPAWVKLMSAVPQATQIDSIKAAREGTMMLPEGKTIKDMVASIRPQPEADFALDTIRDQWIEFQEEFATIAPKLEQGLATLSSSWKGKDFDGFEEQTETVLKNCKTVSGDIAGEDGKGGVVKLLDDKQIEIYDQQGGTACAYPAPKFYMQGTSCGSHQIHIRPPFFKNCEIHKNDEISKAVELAGFDPTVIDEVQEGRETTYNSWIEYVNANPDYEEGGVKGEALATKKADEYADERLISLGAEGSDQLEEESARVNEDVTERHANVEAHVQEIAPDVRTGEATTFNDGGVDKFDPPVLDDGDGGGMPDLDGKGMDDMAPPADLKSLTGDGPGGLNGDTSGLNGNNANLPNSPNGSNLNGLGDENPFASNNDPDNLTGNPPTGYDGGNGLNSPNGSNLPNNDYSGNGLNPNGGGLPPNDYSGGNGLGGLDDNPWNSTTDPDDVTGGLASGGPNAPTPTNIGGTGLGPGSNHLPPPTPTPTPNLGPRRPSTTTGSGPRKLGGLNPSSSGPRKLDSGRGTSGLTGKGLGGTGSPPGSGGRGSGLGGLGSGSGSGLGSGSGSGSGSGRGLGGPGSAAGGAGGRGAGAGAAGGMMAPGGAGPVRGNGDDKESERQFWIAEDEDVWGGAPEDDEEDPYA